MRDGLFTRWDFVFVFDLQLHDLQLHVPQIFDFTFFVLWRIQTIFRLFVVVASFLASHSKTGGRVL